ncbi:hypothetical protein LCGC14_2104030 [marine sediment metagenome]|uniref:Uncharacterized protein n=1 Tax=marine sediment metagenome TaxID=412755 RepID=A0A0F9GM84_9ZZZZ
MTDSRFLKQVTVTGADDSVNYYDLCNISKRFPYVEWGILLSKNSEGYPRFPTLNWLEGFIAEKSPDVHLSGHLCGTWVRDIVDGGTAFINARRNDIRKGFERYQLNFHATQHLLSDAAKFIESLVFLTGVHNQQVIFQMDDTNNRIYHRARSQYGKQRGVDAVALYDVSGGAGVLPEDWPEPMGDYCGYAGGLSPDNLKEQLGKIEQRITNKDGSLCKIWIDAETHLRSPDNQQFDLDKVVQFLEIAKPYVI